MTTGVLQRSLDVGPHTGAAWLDDGGFAVARDDVLWRGSAPAGAHADRREVAAAGAFTLAVDGDGLLHRLGPGGDGESNHVGP